MSLVRTDLAVPRVRAGRRVTDRGDELERLVWPYRLMVPILYLLGTYVFLKKKILGLWRTEPHTNFFLVDGVSISSRRVKEGAARWPALDACYNFIRGRGRNGFQRAIDNYWLHIRNAQAVRNRLKIATRELEEAIRVIARRREGPVRVLSLAAGTAQGVIDVVAKLRLEKIDVRATLIDQDPTALRYARRIAREAGVEKRVTAIEGKVFKFRRYIDFEPDIVEMMGLIDYLEDEEIVLLMRMIRLRLSPKGYFFTCHIHPNSEAFFLKWVVDWTMKYRSLETLRNLLARAGFAEPRLLTEPHGIHSIAVATKD